MYIFLYKIWAKLLTWFGDIYFATSPPTVRACHIRKLMELMQPGDVICRKYIYYLDSYFIPGEYSHSGIVVDNTTMVHSVAEGVCKIDVIDFVKDADGFVLLRPTGLNTAGATKFAVEHVGAPYDFLFNKSEKSAFYCHELTFYSLTEGGGISVPIAGDYVLYSDIVRCCEVVTMKQVRSSEESIILMEV